MSARDVAVREAAEILFAHWKDDTHGGPLPAESRPRDVAAGYDVQAEFLRLTGERRVGWKIAATSAGGQAHIGVTHPLAGPLLESRVVPGGATVPVGGNHMRVAEAEFAFTMGAGLPPRSRLYSMDEVIAAVAALHPAIELPDSRFLDFAKVGAPSLVADFACARWFVLGDPVADDNWRSLKLADCAVELWIDGERVTSGHGRDALDGPDRALAWLANHLSRTGSGLRAGDIITTGVCGKPVPIAANNHIEARFGSLGMIEVRIG